MKTGFRVLDQRWGNLETGNMTVLCSKPGHGKSTLARQIAAHVSQETNVLSFSMETQPKFIRYQLGETAKRNRLMTDFSGSQTSGSIEGLIDSLKPDFRARFVVIDSFMFLNPEGWESEAASYRQERLACRLKAMAMDFDVHVFLVSHFPALQVGQKVSMFDLPRGLMDSADVVAILKNNSRDRGEHSTDEEEVAEIMTSKNRYGQTGKDLLVWSPNKILFRELEEI